MQSESLTPGMVIAGKYVVERTLGRGGMGAVYVAAHVNTGKRLALKVLLPQFVHNADLVGRFLREAQVMGRLQHRHVVDVFDVGRDGDVLFIVMELLEGKPLSDMLHDASLTLEEALMILIRAMEGVSAAHEQGVVHRDLKPDNIFVCIGPSGRLDDPRVLDFGISKLDDGTAQQLTRSGVAMGTPYYMSIEQLSGQRDLDQRVDVYALGVILYEAMAGEPPYVADSISALAIRVLTTQAVHLGQLRPDLPPGLADVVMKAVSRNRDERHRSVRALIEALRPFVPKSAGLSVPEGQGRPLRTPRSGGAHRPAPAAITDDGRSPVGSSGVRTPSPTSPPRDWFVERDPAQVEASHGDDTVFDPSLRANSAHPQAAPRFTPVATQPAQASWHKSAIVAVMLSGALVAGAIWFSRDGQAPPLPVLPDAPVQMPSSSAASPSEPVDRRDTSPAREGEQAAPIAIVERVSDAGAAASDPRTRTPSATLPTQPSAVSRQPELTLPRERAPGRKPRGAARATESKEPTSGQPRPPASAATPANAATPDQSSTTPAAPPRKSAEGRAGKLGSDEF